MKVSVTWAGLAELRRELQTYATDIADDSRPLVEHAAADAADEMRASYPHRSGHLAASVVVEPSADASGTVTAVRVTNTADYAGYFEFGTRYARPGHVFVPILRRRQRALEETIKQEQFPKFNLEPR